LIQAACPLANKRNLETEAESLTSDPSSPSVGLKTELDGRQNGPLAVGLLPSWSLKRLSVGEKPELEVAVIACSINAKQSYLQIYPHLVDVLAHPTQAY
jgi:hypothetical protein